MKFRFLILLLFSAVSGYCQLSDFTLSVTPSNETCDGNGSILINTTGLTAGSQVLFSLYKLPDLATPLNQFSQTNLGGLQSGNYRLVATQTLAPDVNTQQKDFTIADQVVPLVFTITPSATTNCSQSGNLTVDVTTGTGPFFYQITQGPVIVAPQVSNVFTGLPSGLYRVRVIDGCGSIGVLDYTLVLDSNNLSIDTTSLPANANSCTDIDVLNIVTPSAGNNIIYPLNVVYTVHNPNTGDQVIPVSFPSGPADELQLSLNLPIIPNTPYTYDIVITDSCNNAFLGTGEVDASPQVTMASTPNECGQDYLNINVNHFFPPYTITFLQAPPGFNPASFNAGHPGPFTTTIVDYGTETNTVPLGFYLVQVVDACNHIGTMKVAYEVKDEPLTPIKTVTNASCINPLGAIRIKIPEGRSIVSAIIISAPAAYPNPLPSDVSASVNSTGELVLNSLPIGIYVFNLIDSCTSTYMNVTVTITAFSQQGLSAISRPSCQEDLGSVRIRSNNGALTAMSITAAPPGFTGALPFDVSSGIVNGVFYRTDLPAGLYTFSGTDACNFTNPVTVAVIGYDQGLNNYTMIPHCGSFDVALADTSNIIGISYWLQKQLNATTDTWGHPQTNVPYVSGTDPTDTNSLGIQNNSTLFNQTDHGVFRIVKVYQTFDGGSTNCRRALEPTFSFSGDLEVVGSYTLDCDGGGGPSSVYLDVQGVPPYHFTIEQKDGVNFPVDNGNSNVFNNLAPGLYTFKVTDNCTRERQPIINVGTLLPLVQANDPVPGELVSCLDGSTNTDTFNLTSLADEILGNQAPENYTVTYHLSQADADSGANPLPENYTNITNPQTIYVRVEHKTITICHDTTSFKLYVGRGPALNTGQDPIYVCDSTPVRIFADPGFVSYLWSDGSTRPYLDVTQGGTYSVTVSNIYGSTRCGTTKDIVVTASGIAVVSSIETQDWTDNHNSITVHLTSGSIGDYVYSLDGVNFQSSNVFEGLVPGLYKIFIKDLHQCGITDIEVALLNYPKFFTPNGDGFNDYWQIKFAALEPHMTIYVFDRYGKLLAGFDSESLGWDGNYNGRPMPSTDYWFKVERADGTIYKGHFAMKR